MYFWIHYDVNFRRSSRIWGWFRVFIYYASALVVLERFFYMNVCWYYVERRYCRFVGNQVKLTPKKTVNLNMS